MRLASDPEHVAVPDGVRDHSDEEEDDDEDEAGENSICLPAFCGELTLSPVKPSALAILRPFDS